MTGHPCNGSQTTHSRADEGRPAIDDLVAHADLEGGRAVFEFGFGTGALARGLFEQHLPAEARYVGVDISPHMHDLASRRLRAFADRVELRLSDGGVRLPFADGVFDRFLSSYVLDLLAPTEIDLVVAEPGRMLAPGGLLCLTSLTTGTSASTRAVARIWQTLWELRSELVGGCRPIRIADHLDQTAWSIHHHAASPGSASASRSSSPLHSCRKPAPSWNPARQHLAR